LLGPFEEEEEGIGVASDVVKVEGEDPATSGPLNRNDPGTVTIPQYRFTENKAKQSDASNWHILYLFEVLPSVLVNGFALLGVEKVLM